MNMDKDTIVDVFIRREFIKYYSKKDTIVNIIMPGTDLWADGTNYIGEDDVIEFYFIDSSNNKDIDPDVSPYFKFRYHNETDELTLFLWDDNEEEELDEDIKMMYSREIEGHLALLRKFIEHLKEIY